MCKIDGIDMDVLCPMLILYAQSMCIQRHRLQEQHPFLSILPHNSIHYFWVLPTKPVCVWYRRKREEYARDVSTSKYEVNRRSDSCFFRTTATKNCVDWLRKTINSFNQLYIYVELGIQLKSTILWSWLKNTTDILCNKNKNESVIEKKIETKEEKSTD